MDIKPWHEIHALVCNPDNFALFLYVIKEQKKEENYLFIN